MYAIRSYYEWIVAVTVMLPTLIEIIDISVANVSLDHIRGSLSAGIDEASWVLTSYLVSNAIIIPMTGWLARTFGRKRYLLVSRITSYNVCYTKLLRPSPIDRAPSSSIRSIPHLARERRAIARAFAG